MNQGQYFHNNTIKDKAVYVFDEIRCYKVGVIQPYASEFKKNLKNMFELLAPL